MKLLVCVCLVLCTPSWAKSRGYEGNVDDTATKITNRNADIYNDFVDRHDRNAQILEDLADSKKRSVPKEKRNGTGQRDTTGDSGDCICQNTFTCPEVVGLESEVQYELVKTVFAMQRELWELKQQQTSFLDMVSQSKNNTDAKKRNIKQCSSIDLNDDGNGPSVINACSFAKQGSGTVVRVAWNGLLRLRKLTSSSTGVCRRYYITINGAECSDPATIDAQLYIDQRNMNIHRTSYLEGLCRGVPAGLVTAQFHIGPCADTQYEPGDAYSGWSSTTRFILEEVDVTDQDTIQ